MAITKCKPLHDFTGIVSCSGRFQTETLPKSKIRNITKDSQQRKRRGGFTLVEIMVSVAIIAILAILLLPAAARIKEKAQSIRCMGNLKILYQGFLGYAADHEMTFPCDRINPQTGLSWYGPLKGDEGTVYVRHGGFGKKLPPYFCPANPAPAPPAGAPGFTNYAFNRNLVAVNTRIQSGDPDYMAKRRSLKFGQTNGVKALLIDCYNASENQPAYETPGFPWRDISKVHGDRVNVIFTDGHIESPKVYPPTTNTDRDLNELKQSWFYPVQ